MLSDYEKWKVAFELLSSGKYGMRILAFSTEMDKSDPSILITQLQLTERGKPLDTKMIESITTILDEIGLGRRYEIA